MGTLILSIFLILYGLTALLRLNIEPWVFGILALVSGIILLIEAGLPYARRI